MAVTLRASKQGLEIVDEVRRKRGWTKAGDEWCQAADVASAGLKRFWRGVSINRDTFIAICQAVGVDWQEIADLSAGTALATDLVTDVTDALSVGGEGLSEPSDRHTLTHLQNLPAREYTSFIGRQEEMARLMELLSIRHSAHLISIDGIGGVGKTTLVLEAADRCLLRESDAPTFEAIIFTSAKENYLTSVGLLRRVQQERTLRDICRAIARTLDRRDITHAEPETQLERTRECLARQRTLLIVDNLETLEDKYEVLAFLYDLPPTVKVIITTREQALFVPIRLASLPETDSLRLIQQQALEKEVTLTQTEQRRLFQGTSGIPAAIVYAIGQLASGYSLNDVLQRIESETGDVARFCFSGSVEPLRGQPAHQLLMALAMFPKPSLRDAIAFVAASDDSIATADGLAKLQQLSLIKQRQGRYDMLALTRSYALAELDRLPDFQRQARARWIEWYRNYSEECNRDWKEWQLQSWNLDEEWENLQTVLEWCISHNNYTDFREIWSQVKGYVHVRGYWDDRLTWTNWLIQAAELREDWETAIEVMVDRGSTLTLMGQPKQLEEADRLFSRAWSLRKHKDLLFQFDLATNITVLRIRQQRFTEAIESLSGQKKLLDRSHLEEDKRCRMQIHIWYYEAEICYKTGEYDRARNLYLQALKLAETIGWLRSIIYIKHWLADVAIALNDLDTSQNLLQDGLFISERHKDKRCTASYQRSFANLEKLRGNLTEAKRWAELALSGFDSLAMIPEAEETHAFIQELIAPQPED